MLTRMKQRIDIQTLSVTSAGGGCFNETWTTTASRWANVQIQRSAEEFSFGKDQQANTYRIIMREESFTNKNRLVFGGLVLTIQTISDPTSGGRMMEVIARGEPA